MKNVLILGANGSLARVTTQYLLKKNTDLHLSLYLRNARRLNNPDQSRVDIVDGDVMDYQKLVAAMEGQDVVYANLSGNMKAAAENIVKAMHASGLKRKMLKTLFSG